MNKQGETVICETPTKGKKPTRIAKWKYDAVRQAIIQALSASAEGILFRDLPDRVASQLDASLREEVGSISWYTTTVKLDLEVKGVIRRVDDSALQRLILVR